MLTSLQRLASVPGRPAFGFWGTGITAAAAACSSSSSSDMLRGVRGYADEAGGEQQPPAGEAQPAAAEGGSPDGPAAAEADAPAPTGPEAVHPALIGASCTAGWVAQPTGC